MDGKNFRLMSGFDKLKHDESVSNSAEKARSKLFKPTQQLFESQNCYRLTNESTALQFQRLVLAKE